MVGVYCGPPHLTVTDIFRAGKKRSLKETHDDVEEMLVKVDFREGRLLWLSLVLLSRLKVTLLPMVGFRAAALTAGPPSKVPIVSMVLTVLTVRLRSSVKWPPRRGEEEASKVVPCDVVVVVTVSLRSTV